MNKKNITKVSKGRKFKFNLSSTLLILSILLMISAVIVNFTVPTSITDKDGNEKPNNTAGVSVVTLIVLSFIFLPFSFVAQNLKNN